MGVRSNLKLDRYLLQRHHRNFPEVGNVFKDRKHTVTCYIPADVFKTVRQINTQAMHVFQDKNSHRKYTLVQK